MTRDQRPESEDKYNYFVTFRTGVALIIPRSLETSDVLTTLTLVLGGTRMKKNVGCCLWLLMLVGSGGALWGADDTAKSYFPNQVLRDQNGNPARFYDDLLRGKTVVVHSFFATCHDSCPVMFGKLKALQDSFGDHLGKDMMFLSISVDSANDVPARLHEVAESLHAKPGWLFLSGVKQNVDWVLYKLGQYAPVREEHSTIFLVGNEASGVWTKLDASLPVETLRTGIEKVLDAKPEIRTR